VTFERAAAEADVPVDTLRRIAELYASTKPALIRCGWGRNGSQRRKRFDGRSLRCLAVAASRPARRRLYDEHTASWGITTRGRRAEPRTRVVNNESSGRALLEYTDPAINMLFVYNSNPGPTTPDQAACFVG